MDKEKTISDSLDLATGLKIAHSDLDKILKSLLSEEYVILTVLEKKLIELTPEGQGYAQKGTPEFQYTSALKLNESTPKAQIEKDVGKDMAKIGFSKAMQRKWI